MTSKPNAVGLGLVIGPVDVGLALHSVVDLSLILRGPIDCGILILSPIGHGIVLGVFENDLNVLGAINGRIRESLCGWYLLQTRPACDRGTATAIWTMELQNNAVISTQNTSPTR